MGGTSIALLRPEELELLVCGTPHLNFHELEEVARYEGCVFACMIGIHACLVIAGMVGWLDVYAHSDPSTNTRHDDGLTGATTRSTPWCGASGRRCTVSCGVLLTCMPGTQCVCDACQGRA